ncbi:MAG TPA: hypothetical protein VKG64_19350 [Methylomirabilota bacterium]|nr:hypothetical protein [Methylomirabilota bacterium]
MPRVLAAVALALLAAACAAGPSRPAERPGPMRVADFKPEQIRRPVFFVRFTFGSSFEDEEKRNEMADYEGALLDGLNTRAVLAQDVVFLRERDRKLDAPEILARARALGADHAVYVEVQAARPVQVRACADTRRPFLASATVWSQAVSVVRASDGATRLATLGRGDGLEVYDFDADCGNPRESKRRTATEALNDAVTKLLNRVVGP